MLYIAGAAVGGFLAFAALFPGTAQPQGLNPHRALAAPPASAGAGSASAGAGLPTLMVVTDPGTGCDWLITMPSGFTTMRLDADQAPMCGNRTLKAGKQITDRIAPEQ